MRVRVYPDGKRRLAKEFDDYPAAAAGKFASEYRDECVLVVEPVSARAAESLDWQRVGERRFRKYRTHAVYHVSEFVA